MKLTFTEEDQKKITLAFRVRTEEFNALKKLADEYKVSISKVAAKIITQGLKEIE